MLEVALKAFHQEYQHIVKMKILRCLFVATIVTLVMFVPRVQAQWQRMGGVGILLTESGRAAVNRFGNGLVVAEKIGTQVLSYSEVSDLWSYSSGLPIEIHQRAVTPNHFKVSSDGTVYLGYYFTVGHAGTQRITRWFRSTDSISSWEEVQRQGQYFDFSYPFFITNNGIIVGIEQPTAGDTSSGSKLYFSTDQGSSWIDYLLPTKYVSDVRYAASGIIEANLYPIGFHRSTDLGLSWTRIDSATIPQNLYYAGSEIWYGRTERTNGSQLYRSLDSGSSFEPINIDDGTGNSSPAEAQYVRACSGGTLVVGVNRNPTYDFYLSSDTGATFQKLPPEVNTHAQGVYLHNPARLTVQRLENDFRTETFLHSHDTGRTWYSLASFVAKTIVVAATTERYLYVFTTSGLVHQIDCVSGSKRILSNQIPHALFSTLFDYKSGVDDVMIAGTGIKGILCSSTDGGATFNPITDNYAGVVRHFDGKGFTYSLAVPESESVLVSGSSMNTFTTDHRNTDGVFVLPDMMYSSGSNLLHGTYYINFRNIVDTAWSVVQNDTGRSATFGELQAVIPLSNGTNALFLSATQKAARTGQPGDTSVITLAGLLLHNPETNTTTQPLVPPFHNQQWIYDVLPLGGDSVLVAIGSNIQFDGLPTPSLSSGTLWKGSLQTLEFREVFNGRTDAGNAYNYGWQFAKDSAGRIYASASSGGIVWSRDNGETWQDFDYENVKSWTIRDICIHKGMLFASTTEGLFRRELPTSVDVHDQDDVFLVQVSRRPNPAQNNVRLEFRGLDVLRSVPWSVTVVDVLGRPMAELTPALRQQTGSGTYQYDLDVSGWPTGVYVIGVQAAQYSRSFVVAVAR